MTTPSKPPLTIVTVARLAVILARALLGNRHPGGRTCNG
jgi:hypothetical protein